MKLVFSLIIVLFMVSCASNKPIAPQEEYLMGSAAYFRAKQFLDSGVYYRNLGKEDSVEYYKMKFVNFATEKPPTKKRKNN